jgi:hypothetical protein
LPRAYPLEFSANFADKTGIHELDNDAAQAMPVATDEIFPASDLREFKGSM